MGVILTYYDQNPGTKHCPHIRGGDPLQDSIGISQRQLFPRMLGVVPFDHSNTQQSLPYLRGGDSCGVTLIVSPT